MCYSLWYNAPTMLPAGGQQHRGLLIKIYVNYILSTFKIATFSYISLGLVALLHFCFPAFYVSAYKVCYISV